MLKRIFAGVALAAFLASSPAVAQTALAPPSITWGGPIGSIAPVQQVGYDSGTGLACIVGSTPTCALAVTSSGGSGTTSLTPSGAAGNAIAPSSSTAAESCRVLKASAGNLYSVSGYVGAATWIMVFNATSAPADGAVTPVAWAYSPAAGSWSINYGEIPARFSAGVTVCASSTGPLTKTAVATNNVFSGRVQ